MRQFKLGLSLGILPFIFLLAYLWRGYFAIGGEIVIVIIPAYFAYQAWTHRCRRPRYKINIIRGIGYQK